MGWQKVLSMALKVELKSMLIPEGEKNEKKNNVVIFHYISSVQILI